MKNLKEFFSKETIIKCFVFSMIVSILFMGRLAYVKHFSFFSMQAFKVYLAFTIANFIIFIAIFFVLFWMASRQQKD